MTRKRIAALIQQEVQPPTESTDNKSTTNKSTNNSSAMATTQNIAIADLQLTGQGLFDESKALWQEFIAFDQEHQIAQKVSAQLWRLTKAVGKPLLVLSIKGIQTAVVTVANPENRAALAKRFSKSAPAKTAEASLESVE